MKLSTDKAKDVVVHGSLVVCGECQEKQAKVDEICKGLISEAKDAVARIVDTYRGRVQAVFTETYGV